MAGVSDANAMILGIEERIHRHPGTARKPMGEATSWPPQPSFLLVADV